MTPGDLCLWRPSSLLLGKRKFPLKVGGGDCNSIGRPVPIPHVWLRLRGLNFEFAGQMFHGALACWICLFDRGKESFYLLKSICLIFHSWVLGTYHYGHISRGLKKMEATATAGGWGLLEILGRGLGNEIVELGLLWGPAHSSRLEQVLNLVGVIGRE